MTDNQLGVYVHFPFCRTRCGYCDFPTAASPRIPQRRYTEAVMAEFERRAGRYAGHPLTSIYLGGGTPSLWAPGQAARLLAAILSTFPAASGGVEVTAEINPGDASPRLLAALGQAGINRISVGAQSMNDATLEALGRRHTARQTRRAVAAARRAGFQNISCDIILGLPGQGVDDLAAQIDRLLELEPDHVSAYALTLSPASPLYRRGWREADPDLLADLLGQGRDSLAAAGLPQYEVANHAPPAARSRHNLLYWRGAPYLGLGAHAHSALPDGPRTLREANPSTARYLAGEPERQEVVSPAAARFEQIFLALRTCDGLDRAAHRRRFGDDPAERAPAAAARLQAAGLLRVTRERLAPTSRGIWLADEMALALSE